MLWRRYVGGVWPLLVCADSARAADVTASIHASLLADLVPFDPTTLELRPELERFDVAVMELLARLAEEDDG